MLFRVSRRLVPPEEEAARERKNKKVERDLSKTLMFRGGRIFQGLIDPTKVGIRLFVESNNARNSIFQGPENTERMIRIGSIIRF